MEYKNSKLIMLHRSRILVIKCHYIQKYSLYRVDLDSQL